MTWEVTFQGALLFHDQQCVDEKESRINLRSQRNRFGCRLSWRLASRPRVCTLKTGHSLPAWGVRLAALMQCAEGIVGLTTLCLPDKSVRKLVRFPSQLG